MSAVKAAVEGFSDQPDPKIQIIILDHVTRITTILKKESCPFLCFNQPHKDFLQMLIGAPIIAQRKFYKTFAAKAVSKFADKFFDILVHQKRLAYMNIDETKVGF